MPDHIDAHFLCTRNREILQNQKLCGCFYCLKIYEPKEITDWADGGMTAICPYCLIDSVIYETKQFPLNEGFLQKMRDYWF